MRSGRMLGVAAAAALVAAGCSGRAPSLNGAAGCTNVGTPTRQHELAGVRTSTTALAGNPFGVVTSPDGSWSFVSGFGLRRSRGGNLLVLSNHGFAPTPVHEISLPGAMPAGSALTHDGRYLLVASGNGAIVIDVARAEAGARDPVLGSLRASASARGRANLPGSAIEVTISPDDRFVFVSLEFSNEIAVFDLRAALADRFRRSAFVGAITLGQAVVGTAVSPDGRRLYATSELAAGARSLSSRGTLSVIDLGRAEKTPASSVLTTVTAGCQPVRVVVSPDGKTVWVTARGSDAVLGFDSGKLDTDPDHALVVEVGVGPAPVGLALVAGGRRLVVADSDRFQAPGERSGLSVVDTAAALAGKPALLGRLPAGGFPRELSLERRRGILLVTNFTSGQLEAVDVQQIR